MLVKELRQGMRTNLFVTAFILLQLFMILCVLFAAMSSESDDSNGFFWFFVYVTLIFVQPLRGLGALSSEFRLNTIELIQLTRLDAWRIAFGKWTALNAQTVLLVVTVVPYLVMRYFLGGVNFITDLASVALLTAASCFLSAVAIGVSAFRSTLVRVVIAVLGLFLLSTLGPAIVFGRMFGGTRPFDVTSTCLLLLTAAYGTYLFLTIGASRIAPRSENLAIRKRGGAFLFAAAAIAFHFLGLDDLPVLLAGLALAIAAIDALTEPVPLIPTVARPFRRNMLVRPLAFLFTPGWHTGIFFVSFAFVAWSAGVAAIEISQFGTGDIFDLEPWIAAFSLGGIVTFPLLLIHIGFARRTDTEHHFGVYLFIQVGLLVFTVLAMIAVEASNDFEEFAFYLFPLPSLILLGNLNGRIDESLYFVV